MRNWARKTMTGGLLAAGCLALGLTAGPAGATLATPDTGEAVSLDRVTDRSGALVSVPVVVSCNNVAVLSELQAKECAAAKAADGSKGSGASEGLVSVPVDVSCNNVAVLSELYAAKCAAAKASGGSKGSGASEGLVTVPVNVSCNNVAVLSELQAAKCAEGKASDGSNGQSSKPADASGTALAASDQVQSPQMDQASSASRLPTTGSSLGAFALAGLTLLVLGMLLLGGVRRVRHSALHRP